MSRKPPTPKPRELAADWAAVVKKLPRTKVKPSKEYPEMAEDWAALKNLPQYAYMLEWYFGDAMALHRVKVIAQGQDPNWNRRRVGYIVQHDKTLFRDANWKRSTHTPSRKATFVSRERLQFTRLEVERAFMLKGHEHINDLWQTVRRLRMVQEDALTQIKFVEDALMRHRGVNEFYDALIRIPSKRR